MENHNKLDGMIFTVEKTLKDLGDKVDAEDRAKLEEEIKTAKTELESNDNGRMTAAFEKLANESQAVFAKIYQNAQQPEGAASEGDTEFHQCGQE